MRKEAELAGKIETLEAERDELQARATAKAREIGPAPIADVIRRVEDLFSHVKLCDRVVDDRDSSLDAATNRMEELETCLRLAEARSKALDIARDKWKSTAHDFGSRLDVEVGCNLALREQLDMATNRIEVLETELRLSKEETADEKVKKLTWMQLEDEAEKQISLRIEALQTQLRQAKGATADVIKVSSHWQSQAANLNRQLDAATNSVSKVEGERDALRNVLRDVASRTKYVILSCRNTVNTIDEALEPKGETDGPDTGV